MRIGLDARFYGRDGKGLGRYTERLLTHLGRLPSSHEFVVFLRKENVNDFTPPAKNFRAVVADVPWYSVAEQTVLPRILARERCDLLHFLHFNVPVLYRRRFVVTVHDLILAHFPTRRASTRTAPVYWAKYALYRGVLAASVRRAAHLLTVSEFSKKDLVATFGCDPDRVTVTLEAADALPGPPRPPAAADRFSNGFYLYVGNAYPHKNLEWLVTVLARGWGSGQIQRPLVLVGRRDYFYDRLAGIAARLGVAPRVHFAGSVPDTVLKWLYSHATAYLFPSRYEGFGLPGLEAMTEGLPVVASNATSLPEMYGDAALYFEPTDGPALLSAIERVERDAALRADLIRRGRDRLTRFSWERLARQTLGVYDQCLAG
jgi:glycosyltransferase involved in cell wall biosynthesis